VTPPVPHTLGALPQTPGEREGWERGWREGKGEEERGRRRDNSFIAAPSTPAVAVYAGMLICLSL